MSHPWLPTDCKTHHHNYRDLSTKYNLPQQCCRAFGVQSSFFPEKAYVARAFRESICSQHVQTLAQDTQHS